MVVIWTLLALLYRDFDPAETVKEKMTKIFEVKGVKGLRKLMKEIAITASTGKHDNELIGTANISLKVCTFRLLGISYKNTLLESCY